MDRKEALRLFAEEWIRRVAAGEDAPSLWDTAVAMGSNGECTLPSVCGLALPLGTTICGNCMERQRPGEIERLLAKRRG